LLFQIKARKDSHAFADITATAATSYSSVHIQARAPEGTDIAGLGVRSHAIAGTYYPLVTVTAHMLPTNITGSFSHKFYELGDPSAAWDNVYGDDFHNVGDYFFMDTLDDLQILRDMKPLTKDGSPVIDEKTGLVLIDDDSLHPSLLARNKKGEIEYDPDGKPYISIRAAISHLWGAVKQLDAEMNIKQEIKT
jgi:hypothetical protein